MSKLVFAALISLSFLTACSSGPVYTTVIEALESEEIKVTPIDSSKESELDDIEPISYQLNNQEIIRVYDFVTEEKRELGYQHFQEHQSLLSSHAPIVYQSNHYLVLYFSNALSTTQTPKQNDTIYGEKIEKALSGIK